MARIPLSCVNDLIDVLSNYLFEQLTLAFYDHSIMIL
jgi:hypothetical protein